jgi:hypothetical protein
VSSEGISKCTPGELKGHEKNNNSFSLNDVCSHFAAGITDKNISPITPGCELLQSIPCWQMPVLVTEVTNKVISSKATVTKSSIINGPC